MRMRLLVDSEEIWSHLGKDIRSSEDYIFIQTLSFEGDRVGKMLVSQLLASNSKDTRILVDCFTKWILSDKLLYLPKNLFDNKLRVEAKETNRMIHHLNSQGVRVKFTNPVGPFSFAARNHKKLIVIDGNVAYIGGINFSEHNFSWHDIMLRIEDPIIVEILKRDFLSTWDGRNTATSEELRGIEFHFLDGLSNKAVFGTILKLIEQAHEKIVVESPYMTFPFSDCLRRARQRGVSITIITPEANNFRFLKEYILWEALRSDIEIRLYRGMTHLKAMSIDDTYLIIGSSNFDFLSYRLHQEIVAIITDLDVIAAFNQRVVHEDLKRSRIFEGKVNNVKGHLLNYGLRSMEWFLTLINRPK